MNIKKINTIVGTILWALVTATLFGSCSNHHGIDKRPVKFSDIKRVTVRSDTTQHYEVYLPLAYTTQRKWPVIFMFDPHGDGKLAVEQAKVAAEWFGYILIGSDNSKNNVEHIDQIVNAMFSDALERYSIDRKRIYTAGFSGGGRVASGIALSMGNIRGVITCSAGIPQLKQTDYNKRFDLYAIAGKEDFNYNEVEALNSELNESGWRFRVTAFDGGHKWPPVSYITEAVLWFDFNAMRDGLIPENDRLVDDFYDTIRYHVKKDMNEKHFIKAEEACRKGKSFLYGLHKTRYIDKEYDKIRETDAYNQELQNMQRISEMEEELREGYLVKFSSPDTAWWSNEVKQLNKRIADKSNLPMEQMYSRVKGFLGIVCYSYVSGAMAAHKTDQAEQLMHIYQIVEPRNPDLFFYKALLLDWEHHTDRAVKLLKKAEGYGFTDQSKIRSMFSGKVQKALEAQR